MRRTALALSLLFSSVSHAGIGDSLGLSPFKDWKTIETEHFRVTFPGELAPTAQRATNYLEEAHAALTAQLLWEPVHKTQIVLIDNADAANGLTSAVLRFGIVLYATPPDNWFSTQYYDDWLRLLCFHEYTHLVNMDTAHDFYKVLRVLFGDLLLPNSIWPSWMLEGLAVYMETRYTGSGRGRSSYYEMILRSAAEEGVLDDSRFITLDKVNGQNPYFPYGETAYLFGYHLMNEIALHPARDGKTADGDDEIAPGTSSHPGEGMLGMMSYRSGDRIPFLINDNLENISGKDWYAHWDDWVKSTREREIADLKKIRSRPLTPVEKLTQAGGTTLGGTISPDGKWLAYMGGTSDEINSLWIQPMSGGPARAVYDKLMGSQLAFTPDSKTVVFSSLTREWNYDLYSELKAYSLESDSVYDLTLHRRARDPHISKDGKWITFTVTKDATTTLAIAPLITDQGKLRIGKIRVVLAPPRYDAVYTPKFSSDGKQIYFSWHHNGRTSEEIASIDLATGKPSILVSNGKMNRFPTVSPSGELVYESDLTGIDNLYAFRGGRSVMLTNVTTGLDFPFFDSNGQLYANVFSTKGWDIAHVHPGEGYSTADLTVSTPPFPTGGKSASSAKNETHPVVDYSIFPSILPRQWAPLLLWGPGQFYGGGEILGFDAIDRHEYIIGAAYNTLVQAPDYLASYNNRSLGVNLTLTAENYTSAVVTDSGNNLLAYERSVVYSAAAYLPIQFTYSTLTPLISIYENRDFYKAPGINPSDNDIYARGYWVPHFDMALLYSESHATPLAITTEEGRATTVASRIYLNSGSTFIKTLVSDQEFLRTDFLLNHSVFVPGVKYQWVDRSVNTGYPNTNVTVEGRQSGRLVNSMPNDGLDQISIRGYPLQTFYSKQAAVASLDYRFPLAHLFRGWGTNPIFLQNLKGFVYGEDTYFPNGTKVKSLPSAGGGLELDVATLNLLPLGMILEYDKGFRQDFGGSNDFFFGLSINSPVSL